MARVIPTKFVFLPVQLVRPCEIVAFRISEAIRAGDVKVGERLPSEANLSQQLGVSRPTLREAIKLLSQADVLRVEPGSSGGIFVISQTVPQELCGLPLPELPMDDISYVLEARRLIEPHVARMAAAFGTASDFQAMREAVALSEKTGAPFRRRRITREGVELMTIASTRFNIAVARARRYCRHLRHLGPVDVLGRGHRVRAATAVSGAGWFDAGHPDRTDPGMHAAFSAPRHPGSVPCRLRAPHAA